MFATLRGYDGQLIIREGFNIINTLGPDTQISAIPNSNEKFISFSIGNMKFIDSFAFLSEKLEKLVFNLYDDKGADKYTNFHHMRRFYGEHMDLMCKKYTIRTIGLTT